MKSVIVAALVAFACATPATAISLLPGESADFEVDFSGFDAFEFRRWGYACNDAVLCASGAEGQLAQGATITLSFGSTRGGAEYRFVEYSPLSNSDAVSVPLLGTTIIPADEETVFVRVHAVDDAFTIKSVVLSEGLSAGAKTGVGTGGALTVVPLPASAALTFGGLAALGAVRRGRSQGKGRPCAA